MATIIPAILEDSIDAFNDRAASVLSIPDVARVQVDFSDGKFTPRTTVQPGDLDVLNPAYTWEAHLMVEKPEAYFFDLKIVGFNVAIFHFEAVKEKEKLQKLSADLRGLKLSPGLAIKADTAVEEIYPYLGFFDQILVLSVEPGYQGQSFIESSARSIEKLRNHDKNVIIEVDGAIKLDNAKKVVQLGADFLVVGSALYASRPDEQENAATTPSENFEKFKVEVQNT